MKRLNKNYPASSAVMALATNKVDKYVGATVKFLNLKGRGAYHANNIFEIVGTQRVWGYDTEGHYTMIDGYRLMSITCKDDFGCPASLVDLEILSMTN